MTVFVRFSPIVSGIAACVQSGLAADSIAGVPTGFRVVTLYPGFQVPWDQCQCGQLAVNVRKTFGSDHFPALAVDHNQGRCGPRLQVAEIGVSVARCVPAMDLNGEPPASGDLFAAAMIVEADREATRAALQCCLQALFSGRRIAAFAIGESVTQGDLGGCVSVETTLWIGLANCLCGGS